MLVGSTPACTARSSQLAAPIAVVLQYCLRRGPGGKPRRTGSHGAAWAWGRMGGVGMGLAWGRIVDRP
jgi:hypothetical protein